MNKHSIILGGGCFWCIESVFQDIKGVISAVSGYAGGHDPQPTYKAVCSGLTGHTEVVKIDYDSDQITLEQLLEVFFVMHNPTTLNRQGNDVGTQYRSAIYYTETSDLIIIESAVANAEKIWGLPIVTEVDTNQKFYPAEAHHQNYYTLNPEQGYCQYVISPKLAKLRSKFSALMTVIVLLVTAQVAIAQQIILPENIDPLLEISGVPVMNVNFYLMNAKTKSDPKTTSLIGENIKILNREFEGVVKFNLSHIVLDEKQIFLPEIKDAVYGTGSDIINDFTRPIEVKGGVNIFVCETYITQESQGELMGFTPVLKARQYAYEYNSPRFDRIYMSYIGLEETTTLVHEMGHFLGLKHPWRLNDINLELQGLTSQKVIDENHMSYTAEVHEFTDEQLERMQHFALQFRRYLCVQIDDHKLD